MEQRVFAPQTITFPATLEVAVFSAAALIAFLSAAFFTWRAIASRDPLLLSLALVAAGGCVAFTYEAFAIQTRLVPTISRVVAVAFQEHPAIWLSVYFPLLFLGGALALHFTRLMSIHWWVPVGGIVAFLAGALTAWKTNWLP
jgi:cytochrome c oxidase assembly factor CtaG